MPHNFVFSQTFFHSVNAFNRDKLQNYFFSKSNVQARLDAKHNHIFHAPVAQPNVRLDRLLQALRKMRKSVDARRTLCPSLFELRSVAHTLRSTRKSLLPSLSLTVYIENPFLREAAGFVAGLLGATVSDFVGKGPVIVDRAELPTLLPGLHSMGVEAVVDCRGLFETFFYFEPLSLEQWEIRLSECPS